MGAEQSLEQTDPSSASPFSRLLPKQGTAGVSPSGRVDGVVVVSGPSSSGGGGGGQQTEIDKLAKIPLFSPFIKSSVNFLGFDSNSIDGSSSTLSASSPSSGLGGPVPMLDTRALASISTRLQEHLRQCAEAVAFDQNALCNRMNEIDLSIAAAHSCLAERHRRYTRLCEQLVQTKDMCALASKVRAGVEQTHRGLADLNNMLPPDLRIPQIPDLAPLPARGSNYGDDGSKSSRSVSTSNSMEVPTSAGKRVFETAASSTSSETSSHLPNVEESSNEQPQSSEPDGRRENDEKAPPPPPQPTSTTTTTTTTTTDDAASPVRSPAASLSS